MIIKCEKSGGFMGNQMSCTIEFDELNPAEKNAFEELQKESGKDPRMRDSYVYSFKILKDNTEEEKVDIDETYLTEKMIPFINKVDSKLK